MAGSGFLQHACRVLCNACHTDIPLAAGESIGFRDACDRCRTDLHICLNCTHHDRTAYNDCQESSAERILDPDRANRCEYFRPMDDTSAEGADRGKALADLENLFNKN